ncbi:MAG: glycosyl transferase, partial [Rhodoferax sp.]|nr:glycosyl transferase [Rhodoferax sp.]
AVQAIAQRCVVSARPVQMLNLMRAGAGASRKHRILEFAMRMKNLVRPLGSSHLGQACHLMGTGMALPWALISTARLATGHIAEDMQLGIELAGADQAPQFFPYAEVSSHFPTDTGVAKVQKSRWEHGHLAVIMQELPALAWAALRTRKPALLVMALDLLIPPVALYLLVLLAALLGTLAASLLWPVWFAAAAVMTTAAALFALSIGLTWLFFGRDLLSLGDLVSTPAYALWKLPVYIAYFLKRRSGWTRTQRPSAG